MNRAKPEAAKGPAKASPQPTSAEVGGEFVVQVPLGERALVAYLQGTVGNHAVNQLMRRHGRAPSSWLTVPRPATGAGRTPVAGASARVGTLALATLQLADRLGGEPRATRQFLLSQPRRETELAQLLPEPERTILSHKLPHTSQEAKRSQHRPVAKRKRKRFKQKGDRLNGTCYSCGEY